QFLQYMCALKEIKSNVGNEIEHVTAAVNLTSELDKLLGAYSGGMKQRLLCANALLGTPKVLVLDEPTAGLDPKERVRLRELMKKTSENAIVLIATHVVQDIESVADEILLLKAGELVDMASPKDLINEYASGGSLEDVYLNIFGQGEV
ncbi:MAG: ATP-binding cassette domain-containing protein, partial [Oscillospiraceae bacterium]